MSKHVVSTFANQKGNARNVQLVNDNNEIVLEVIGDPTSSAQINLDELLDWLDEAAPYSVQKAFKERFETRRVFCGIH